MKTHIVKVSSVLSPNLKEAGNSHQYGGRDPGETEGKRSGGTAQNRKQAWMEKPPTPGSRDLAHRNTGRPVQCEFR